MRCPFCQGPVEWPETAEYPAYCGACDRFFRFVSDYSWFKVAGQEFTEILVWAYEQ